MAKVDSLLNEYSESHQNQTNKLVHWICVPAIATSLLGLIWCIPVPHVFASVHFGPFPFNWAIIFIILALIYYFSLSVKLGIGMILIVALLGSIGIVIATLIPLPLWATCLIFFSLAWIGQFWGHKVEGKKPSFLKDVQFLLIGPLWLLSFVYQKLGIRYS